LDSDPRKSAKAQADFCAESYGRWQQREEYAEKSSVSAWRRRVAEKGDPECEKTQDALEGGWER
jgi:hypothetical protein